MEKQNGVPDAALLEELGLGDNSNSPEGIPDTELLDSMGLGAAQEDGVVDGDTVGRKRLTGFDAPELLGPGSSDRGQIAKEALKALLDNGYTLKPTGEKDSYGRELNELLDPEGKPADQELVEAGLAHPTRWSTPRVRAAQDRNNILVGAGLSPTLNPILAPYAKRAAEVPMTDIMDGRSFKPREHVSDRRGTFSRSWDRGVGDLKQVVGGLSHIASELTGSESLKETGEDWIEAGQLDTASSKRAIEDFTEIDSAGDFLTYAIESIGEAAPGLLIDGTTAIASGGVGGMAIRRAAKEATKEYIKHRVRKTVTRVAAGGAALSAGLQGAGGMEAQLEQAGVEDSLGYSLGMGAVSAGTSFLPVAKVLDKVLANVGDDAVRKAVKDRIIEGIKTATVGGSAEIPASAIESTANQLLSALALNQDALETFDVRQTIDDTIRGALGGTAMSGGASAAGQTFDAAYKAARESAKADAKAAENTEKNKRQAGLIKEDAERNREQVGQYFREFIELHTDTEIPDNEVDADALFPRFVSTAIESYGTEKEKAWLSETQQAMDEGKISPAEFESKLNLMVSGLEKRYDADSSTKKLTKKGKDPRGVNTIDKQAQTRRVGSDKIIKIKKTLTNHSEKGSELDPKAWGKALEQGDVSLSDLTILAEQGYGVDRSKLPESELESDSMALPENIQGLKKAINESLEWRINQDKAEKARAELAELEAAGGTVEQYKNLAKSLRVSLKQKDTLNVSRGPKAIAILKAIKEKQLEKGDAAADATMAFIEEQVESEPETVDRQLTSEEMFRAIAHNSDAVERVTAAALRLKHDKDFSQSDFDAVLANEHKRVQAIDAEQSDTPEGLEQLVESPQAQDDNLLDSPDDEEAPDTDTYTAFDEDGRKTLDGASIIDYDDAKDDYTERASRDITGLSLIADRLKEHGFEEESRILETFKSEVLKPTEAEVSKGAIENPKLLEASNSRTKAKLGEFNSRDKLEGLARTIQKAGGDGFSPTLARTLKAAGIIERPFKSEFEDFLASTHISEDSKASGVTVSTKDGEEFNISGRAITRRSLRENNVDLNESLDPVVALEHFMDGLAALKMDASSERADVARYSDIPGSVTIHRNPDGERITLAGALDVAQRRRQTGDFISESIKETEGNANLPNIDHASVPDALALAEAEHSPSELVEMAAIANDYQTLRDYLGRARANEIVAVPSPKERFNMVASGDNSLREAYDTLLHFSKRVSKGENKNQGHSGEAPSYADSNRASGIDGRESSEGSRLRLTDGDAIQTRGSTTPPTKNKMKIPRPETYRSQIRKAERMLAQSSVPRRRTVSFARKFFESKKTRLDRISPTLGSMFYRRSGEAGTGDTFEGLTRDLQIEWFSKLTKIYPTTKNKEFNRLLQEDYDNLLKGGNATRLKRFLDRVNQQISKMDPTAKPPEVPVLFNPIQVQERSDEFLSILKKHGVAEPDAVLDSVIERGGILDGGAEITPRRIPGSRVISDKPKLMAELSEADFFNRNAPSILSRYLYSSAERAAFASIFGENVAGGFDPMAKLNEALADIPIRSGEKAEAIKLIQAITGQYKNDVDPAWHKFNSMAVGMMNLRLLLFSGVASVVELVLPYARSKNVHAATTGLLEFSRKIATTKGRNEITQIADDLGVLTDHMVGHSLEMLYNSGELTIGKTLHKATDTMFRLNGQYAVVKLNRLMAAFMGHRFLQKHSADGADARSQRYLAELGAEPEKIRKAFELEKEYGRMPEADELKDEQEIEAVEHYRKANRRFVDESVLNPKRSETPLFADDPHFALFAHLKNYAYAFWSVFHRGIVHNEIKSRANGLSMSEYFKAAVGYSPALAFSMVMFMGMGAVSREIRELIKYQGDNPHLTELSTGKALWDNITRSGMLGPVQTAETLFTSHGWANQSALAYAAGPMFDFTFNTILNGDFMERPSELLPIANQLPKVAKVVNN